MKKANIVASIVGMLFSLYAFLFTFTFKHFKNVPVGPEFFPRWLAVFLFACCALLLVLSIFSKTTAGAPTISPLNKDMQRMLLAFIGVIIYAYLWKFAGFLIATPLLVFGVLYLLGIRSWLKMVIYAAASTAVIFLLFKFALGIEMPLGFMSNWF